MIQKSLFSSVAKREEVKHINTRRGGRTPCRTNENTEKTNIYDPVYTEIQRCRLRILVHSCLYYEFNANLISDREYDEISKQLELLQRKHPQVSKLVPYYKEFKNWEGITSSGFDLPYRNQNILNTARGLLDYAM